MPSWSNPENDSYEEADFWDTTSHSTLSRSQRSSRDGQHPHRPRASSAPSSPAPPTAQPAPCIITAEARACLDAAAMEFLRCFPDQWQTIETSAEGLLCGWHAVILSMSAQHPMLPCPALEELIEIFEQQSMETALWFLMENTNNFSVDQVAAVLTDWGWERGLNLRLGYLEEGQPPILAMHPNEDDDVLVVWVHHDGIRNGGIGHFSGMMGWGVNMNEEEGGEERGGGAEESTDMPYTSSGEG
ncbi:MAG: hypothetical protein Q9195_006482 [Heterodermia aff. obscurata]